MSNDDSDSDWSPVASAHADLTGQEQNRSESKSESDDGGGEEFRVGLNPKQRRAAAAVVTQDAAETEAVDTTDAVDMILQHGHKLSDSRRRKLAEFISNRMITKEELQSALEERGVA